MKLISLNIWAGKIHKPLTKFIRKHSSNTDIFCFQEVLDSSRHIVTAEGFRSDIFKDVSGILPDYKAFFAPIHPSWVFLSSGKAGVMFGLACFVRNNIKISAYGDFYVYKGKNAKITGQLVSRPRKVQYVALSCNGKTYNVLNFHGLVKGNVKNDCPERIEQSKKIFSFITELKGIKILCGDFNLNPDTKSLKILDQGMRNLIKEKGILSTRSSYYKKDPKFADYILISPDVKVKKFLVIKNNISDHLPLQLNFD